ncbi:MAG: NUDIX domain-containing protein [Patescibacteria group bacterium]
MEKELFVTSRGIIYHDEKILLVKHDESLDYFALPGGHIEWAEDPKDCIEREIIEELGVKPEIGRLLYVNSFVKDQKHAIEFFFEIINVEDYLDTKKLKNSTHGHEIFEIKWVGKNDGIKILPKGISEDFLSGNLLADNVRFLKD